MSTRESNFVFSLVSSETSQNRVSIVFFWTSPSPAPSFCWHSRHWLPALQRWQTGLLIISVFIYLLFYPSLKFGLPEKISLSSSRTALFDFQPPILRSPMAARQHVNNWKNVVHRRHGPPRSLTARCSRSQFISLKHQIDCHLSVCLVVWFGNVVWPYESI